MDDGAGTASGLGRVPESTDGRGHAVVVSELRSGAGLPPAFVDDDGGLNALGRGHVVVMSARSQPLIAVSAFLGPLLIDLAERTASSDGKVSFAGVRMEPGTVVTVMSFLGALLATLLAPLVGSVVDHTSARRGLLLSLLASSMVGCGAIFASLSDEGWPWAAAITTLMIVLLELLLLPLLAYLPETSRDHTAVHHAAAMGLAGAMGASLANIVLVLFANMLVHGDDSSSSSSSSSGADDDATPYDELRFLARVSLVVSIAAILLFGLPAAVHYLPVRRSLSPVEPGDTVFTAGFRKLGRWSSLLRHEFPQVRLALVVVAFAGAGVFALIVVSGVFLKDELGFSNVEIGTAIMVIMLLSVPAAWLWLAAERHWGSKRTLALLLSIFGFNLLVGSAAVSQAWPLLTYAHIVVYGVIFGPTIAMLRSVYATVVPGDREVEFMAMYATAAKVLCWCPPLVFSIVNESFGGTRVAACSTSLFFFAALWFLRKLDPVQAAADIAATLGHRRFAAAEAAARKGSGATVVPEGP